MQNKVRRIYVEKKPGYDMEARSLFKDLTEYLGISGITGLRVLNRYDVEGLNQEEYNQSLHTIFSEPMVDMVIEENLERKPGERWLAIEYLPGQYDQRADSAAQCVQILTRGERPMVRSAKLLIIEGNISDEEFMKIKNYCINPVESREASLDKPETLAEDIAVPERVEVLEGFIDSDDKYLEELRARLGLAMTSADLSFCREYFRNEEKRDPTITEIRLIDTYWSDHCRHTTFLTAIDSIQIDEGPIKAVIETALNQYLATRKELYRDREKDISLMDLGTIAGKYLKHTGKLDDLEESEEINACSIIVPAEVNGKTEQWLVMFKNETHNHPTEIEPFGGAATCLGGAIRDPLSGRAYVYQAMRVTGSGDPRKTLDQTLPGKLPQRKITTGAASGYSSYGNQIGLSTGHVAEIYHEGYVAKRMEIGAVIGAVPQKNVIREKPMPGDVVILLGGRTGRDGCGGATGSSKAHTEESILTCGAEVQKGNPPTERKIQRLFRRPEVTGIIKRCNDFGAGGVSVAIGELAPGLVIDLDAVPKKYEGLDGTELAISESQERMAVVVAEKDADSFIRYAAEENLEATRVAVVTDNSRLVMKWRGNIIVDISRDFLDTNGVKQHADVRVTCPDTNHYVDEFVSRISSAGADTRLLDGEAARNAWIENLRRLNVCSQKGLVERFDSTIGAGTVVMPFGGKYQLTPHESMIAKLPVLDGDTTTGTIMSWGFDPYLSSWSPFHGAVYAIVSAVAKVAAAGGDYRRIRLTLQEYFERLGKDPKKWGKPFSSVLGAFYAQMKLGLPAIGGKDSMSGSFNDMSVPPTLVAFAVAPTDVRTALSPEFKKAGSTVVLIPLERDSDGLPNFEKLKENYTAIYNLACSKSVLAAHTVGMGGIAGAISKMAFGNKVGFSFSPDIECGISLFEPDYGSVVLELDLTCETPDLDQALGKLLGNVKYKVLGFTVQEPVIKIQGAEMLLDDLIGEWESPLEKVFPTRPAESNGRKNIDMDIPLYRKKDGKAGDGTDDNTAGVAAEANICSTRVGSATSVINGSARRVSFAKPRVFIPVFPGTNCEYDSRRAFEKAGAVVETLVVRNLSPRDIEDTIMAMERSIRQSQIIMLPGGFSGGDEPDGSGKFIATAFRNPYLKEAVMDLLKNRDGLILGICNGFQALVKLGLVPFGEIRDLDETCPTLTFNTINRHVSCMVRTRVVSNLSPWLSMVKPGDIHTVPVSHGEGRFVASEAIIENMIRNGQVAFQYVDQDGRPTMDIRYNPNGSVFAIEGITSPDGRVLGKMAHSERIGDNVAINVPGDKDQKIFESGVEYFR